MANQGKCLKCKTYFSWDKNTPFRKLCCPICAPKNIALKRTTNELGTGKNPRFIRRHLDKPPLKKLYLS